MRLGVLRQHVRRDGLAKVGYATKSAAMKAMKDKPVIIGRPSRVYLCNVCSAWHIGHLR